MPKQSASILVHFMACAKFPCPEYALAQREPGSESDRERRDVYDVGMESRWPRVISAISLPTDDLGLALRQPGQRRGRADYTLRQRPPAIYQLPDQRRGEHPHCIRTEAEAALFPLAVVHS